MRNSVYGFILSICFCLISLFGNAQTVIQMEDVGGVYKIPCTVNGLKLKMIFDPGASNVCLSETTALMMLENDYLSVKDIKGNGKSTVADGSIVNHTKIILKKVQIGEKVLNNVEAVVIHGQDAPLLFGQTALRKLGHYTISGNRLILGSDNNSSQKTEMVELIGDEIDRLIQEAYEAYFNGAYSVAVEKYQVLYNHNYLSALGAKEYADCLYFLDRDQEALAIYKSIQTEIETSYPAEKTSLYFHIAVSCKAVEEYDESIKYFEKVKYVSAPWSKYQYKAVVSISGIYEERDNVYKAKREIEDYISQYLSYMEIKASDCWDKLYVDKFLADLYWRRSLCESTYNNDAEKYCIISAAWGNKDAIEWCKNHNLGYNGQKLGCFGDDSL